MQNEHCFHKTKLNISKAFKLLKSSIRDQIPYRYLPVQNCWRLWIILNVEECCMQTSPHMVFMETLIIGPLGKVAALALPK